MDVFVRGIPPDVADDTLVKTLEPHLHSLGIVAFEFKRLRNKSCGSLTLPHRSQGEKLLQVYGQRQGPRTRTAGHRVIKLNDKVIHLSESRDKPDTFVVRRLQAATPATRKDDGKFTKSPIEVGGLDCGFFDTQDNGELMFNRCYRDRRSGFFYVGRNRLMVDLQASVAANSENMQMVVEYHTIESMLTGSFKNPMLVLVLQSSPTFYTKKARTSQSAHYAVIPADRPMKLESDPVTLLERHLSQLQFGQQQTPSTSNEEKTFRVCSLGKEHAEVVGKYFVYHIMFADFSQMQRAVSSLRHERSAPSTHVYPKSVPTRSVSPRQAHQTMIKQLDKEELDFEVKFQLQTLAENGILCPQMVQRLFPMIHQMLKDFDTVQVAEGLRALRRALPFAGPQSDNSVYQLPNLVKRIRTHAANFQRRGSIYRIAQKYEHIALVYKAFISPTGMWLDGPELETKNRVLRKYLDKHQYFMRVCFCDEDGEQLRYERRIDRSAVFDRFRGVLNGGLTVANRTYTFLGFSHSSLRTQSCWFMTSFWDHAQSNVLVPQMVIRGLGDFHHMTCPAKTAARIGQAFSDATETIPLVGAQLEIVSDISRNGRCFTDGNGTISPDLLRLVNRRFLKSKKAYATVLQIRSQGFKGVLSLDVRLQGLKLVFRESMDKFPSPHHMHLEITGAAHRPLPMFLNRQLIIILEALGVDPEAILALQRRALQDIEDMTKSPTGAARFLELQHFGTAVALPQLIRSLHRVGLHFKSDPFLTLVVELAARVQLRQLKHKARIPVPDAHTLYGIVDETGSLKTREIHVIVKDRSSGDVTCRTGTCYVTRAPGMHPGDVQQVTAVDVPKGSSNEALHNCIIFSQHGERDLPSMLSGGDLDGDLFNVIFDPTLFPKRTVAPADYPKVKAKDIGRPVEIADMSDFFVQFMEEDKLGYISNAHMSLADQKAMSVHDKDCIQLAQMASVAVDFSKTQIPVSMDDFPNIHKDLRSRPAHMAPAPHLILHHDLTTMTMEDDMDYHGLTDAVDKALGGGQSSYHYYESSRVLGQLYRNIDETRFLEKTTLASTDPNARSLAAANDQHQSFLESLLDKVTAIAHDVYWDNESNRLFAAMVQGSYEQDLLDLMYKFSPYVRQPLSELEVFCGTILGRNGAMPSKRARDSTSDMKDSFERLARETIQWIKKGDYEYDEDDEDEVNDSDTIISTGNLSTFSTGTVQEERLQQLERSIACLAVAVEEPSQVDDRYAGQLRSFAYVAAGICLNQIEQYQEMMRRMKRQQKTALGGGSSTAGGRALGRTRR